MTVKDPTKPKGVFRPGKQPGAGRPKGVVSKRSKAMMLVADNALRKGKTPLEIMLKNMRHFDEECHGLWSRAIAMLEEAGSHLRKAEDILVFADKVAVMFDKMRECRMDAQKCATDAAPYVHARFTSIEYRNMTDKVARKPEMSDDESTDYFNKLRLRPTSDAPLQVTIDNETGDLVKEEMDQ